MSLLLDLLCGAGVGWLLLWGAPKVGEIVEDLMDEFLK